MSAQLILIGSLTLQALVQPYESALLNVLDVISLFTLIATQVRALRGRPRALPLACTQPLAISHRLYFLLHPPQRTQQCTTDRTLQVLSILYLYLDTNGDSLPFGIDRKGLEVGMTIALFALNFSVIATLFIAWIARLAFEKLLSTRRKIAAAKGLAAKLGVGEIEMRVLEAESEPHMQHTNPIVAGVAAGIPAPRPPAVVDGEVKRLNELLTSENSMLKEENTSVKGEISLLKEEVSKLKAERQGAAMKVAVADPPRGLPPGWVEHYTAAGKVYYGNAHTGETTWSKPAQTQYDEKLSGHV
jgi:hypothetical protein